MSRPPATRPQPQQESPPSLTPLLQYKHSLCPSRGPGCPRNKPKKFRFEPKQTETKNKKFLFVSVFRTYIETSETNRTILKQTEINQNNPKFSEKYQNMLSIPTVLVGLCLFQFNRNIKTLCFGIEAKQPKKTFCFG
jgi:hypothetical protein